MPPLNSREAVNADTPAGDKKDYTWCAVFVIPLILVIMLLSPFFQKCYTWIRPEAAGNSGTATSLPTTTFPARDLSQLEAAIPSKKCCDLKVELSNQNHAYWATVAPSIICVICLEGFKDADEVRHLACEHIFHSVCISTWYLARHDTCPICSCDFIHTRPALQKPCQAHLETRQ